MPIALATADIALAMKDAALIVIPSPATAQARHRPGHGTASRRGSQTVFLATGHLRQLRDGARSCVDLGNTAEVAWAETGTLRTWRASMARAVNITVRAVRLPTGVYPARSADAALAVIRAAYPASTGAATPSRRR